MSNKLNIELERRIDSDGNTYYLGRLECPVLIDCREGATFMVFTAVEGQEVIQVCNPTSKKPKIKYNDR